MDKWSKKNYVSLEKKEDPYLIWGPYFKSFIMALDPFYTVTVRFGSVTKVLRIGLPFTLVFWIRNTFDPANRNAFGPARKAN